MAEQFGEYYFIKAYAFAMNTKMNTDVKHGPCTIMIGWPARLPVIIAWDLRRRGLGGL
jgi:hypothetical protein